MTTHNIYTTIPTLSKCIPHDHYGTHQYLIKDATKNMIYFQLPPCLLSPASSNSHNKKNHKSLKLIFSLVDKRIKKQINALETFFEHVQNLVQAKNPSVVWVRPGTFCIDDKYAIIFENNSTLCFDNKGNPCSHTTYHGIGHGIGHVIGQSVECIVGFPNVTIKKALFAHDAPYHSRLSCVIFQTRILHSTSTPFKNLRFANTFVSPQNSENNPTQPHVVEQENTIETKCDTCETFITHPIVGKYFKMLHHKIPRPAIEQKMAIDSLEPLQTLLSFKPHQVIPHAVLEKIDEISSKNTNLVLSLQNKNLKDAGKRTLAVIKHDHKNPERKNFSVSLDDITSTLRNLKKTKHKK